VFGTAPLPFFQLRVAKHLPASGTPLHKKKVELEANSTFFLEHLRGTPVFGVLYSHMEL
jgi:hypothetical protein